MLKIYSLSALVAGLAFPAPAQTLDPTFASPSGLYTSASVYSLGPAQADGKRVIVGDIQRVAGQPVSRLFRLDASGNLDLPFTQNVGTVSRAIYQVSAGLNGQYLLRSTIAITAGGITRNGLLRLNADGTADASLNVGSGPQYATGDAGELNDAAVQPDGKLVLAGSFDSFNGQPANGLLRLNADGSPDPSFSAGTGVRSDYSEEVRAVLVQANGQLLVGGTFSQFNGQPANGLLRLNADGSLDPTFQNALPADSRVISLLAQPDGKIIVGSQVGQLSTTLRRLLPTGTADPAFAPLLNVRVSYPNHNLPVLLPSGQLLVLGLNGNNQVTRVNADGTVDATFALNAPPSGEILAAGAQANGDLLLAGPSLNFFGSREGSLVKFNSAGVLQTSFAPQPQVAGTIKTVVRLPGGDLLVGGNFNEWNGQPASHLVRVSSTGAFDAAFTAAAGQLPGTVQALAAQPDGKVLAATSRALVRFTANGAPDNTFSFFAGPAAVTALAVQPDGRILAGGYFGPTAADNRLVRLTDSGARDPSFGRTEFNSATQVFTTESILVQPDGRLVVSSFLNYVDGNGSRSSHYLLRYEATGAADPTFSPVRLFASVAALPNPMVYSLVQQPDGKLLVGGVFDRVNTTPMFRLARFTTAGQLDPTYLLPATQLSSSRVYSLALQPNGRLLVGGTGSSPLLRLLADGQLDPGFSTQNPPNGPVTSLLVQPDGGIVVGGDFTTLTGQPALKLARLTAPNVLAVAAPGAVAAATTLWPVPAHAVLHVQPAASAHPLEAELLDALGRVVRQQALSGPAEFGFDVRGMPVGLYVLRLRYAEGTVARPLSVE